MIKRILYFVIIYISVSNLFAQDPTKFIAVDSNGKMYEINPANCSYTAINQCAILAPFSIALINNYVYFTNYLNLYRFQYNTSGSCEFLGTFNFNNGNNLTSLTSGPNGLIYAASGNSILSYNTITNVFSNLGDLPSQLQSSGDLVFYNGQLLLATTNDKLVQIDLNNLSNSQEVLTFPAGTMIFGLSTISAPCESNQIFAINSYGGFTSLLPIDLATNTVGLPTCTLFLDIYDTASLSENGSSSGILPTFTQIPEICNGATLNSLPIISNNGIAGSWSPALNNTTTTTYTFTPIPGQCATSTTLTITVNNKVVPTFTQTPTICYGSTSTVLPTTSNNGYIGTWSPALNNTTTTTYTFTPTVGQCATTATMTISVDPIPGNPDSMQHPEICSEDFTNINITTTPQIPGTILKWEVIDSSNNVTGFTQSGSGLTSISIYDNLFNNSEDQGFVIYRVTSFLGDCKGLYTDITVVVNPLPKPDLKNGTICVNETSGINYTNYTLDSQLLNPDFTYQWFILNTITDTYEALANANESTYEVNQEGTYKVVVTNETTTCKQSDIATVISAYPAQEISATVTNNFTNNTIITVTTNPTGILNLIYSLDNSEWQDSNIFTGVEPGLHTITVTDLQDCTNLSIEVFVFDYPKFFTPNGDDINDTWNITGLNQPEAKLFIFDRYGKLIKQLSTTSKGWDGNYNGAKLPSGDYWFKLDYTENGIPKQFKSHFSLKR